MTRPISVRALARKMGLSEKTIRRFIREGAPHIPVGRSIFLREEKFEAWFLGRETTQYKPAPYKSSAADKAAEIAAAEDVAEGAS